MGASFKDLIVWQRAIQMCMAAYRLTSGFPDSERFGLTNQLMRASVSVASNIAEGYGRSTTGEYIQFLGHARGSICEVQTQIVIAEGLGFGSNDDRRAAEELSVEVAAMLVAMMKKLKDKQERLPACLVSEPLSLIPHPCFYPCFFYCLPKR